MRALVVSVLVLSALVPLAPTASAADHTVTATDFEWTPAELSIGVGESVEFVLGGGTHNWQQDGSSEVCELPCVVTFPTEGSVGYHCAIHLGMTGTIHVGTPPVLAITAPAAGATVSGLVRVEGTASHLSSAIASVSVRIGAGDAVAATLSGSGTSVTWTADVPTGTIANGAQTIVATGSTTSGLTAQAERGVIVDNPISLDIAVTAASGQAGATTSNSITFSLRNVGNAPAQVAVLAEYLYHGTWRPIGTTTVNVGLGSTAPGVIVWRTSTPHVGAFTVRVTADPEHLLPDVDRSNNDRLTSAGWFTSLVPGIVATEPL